ncbi:MAG: hypothetical protein JW891_14330 [Candidatus Lokiarchaeota archaeon]|nr:hypothetical protein [Candidatus Lokiarchaeota archaeon]
MSINPNVKEVIIFNAGGAIVKREMKLSLQQGANHFHIQNVPASFDPNSAEILLEHLIPEDKQAISLQQTIVSLPDRNNSQQVIDREKSAANSIISYSIDFTREMREKISNICEASSYRTFNDMNGIFDFVINAQKESEVIVKIQYFVQDIRIKWQTSLQVNIDDNNKKADIEGFIIVDNQTGFSYDNVELSFAIFELPQSSGSPSLVNFEESPIVPQLNQLNAPAGGLRTEMMNELNRMKSLKRTQRYKQLK